MKITEKNSNAGPKKKISFPKNRSLFFVFKEKFIMYATTS